MATRPIKTTEDEIPTKAQVRHFVELALSQERARNDAVYSRRIRPLAWVKRAVAATIGAAMLAWRAIRGDGRALAELRGELDPPGRERSVAIEPATTGAATTRAAGRPPKQEVR